MKNYIVSLSKRALLLSGALAIFTACDDGDLGDIYKGNSSGEYVSDVNWTDAADKSTGTYIKYFYENASGIHRKPENRQARAVAADGRRDMHWTS